LPAVVDTQVPIILIGMARPQLTFAGTRLQRLRSWVERHCGHWRLLLISQVRIERAIGCGDS
jgi:hypothetical protein